MTRKCVLVISFSVIISANTISELVVMIITQASIELLLGALPIHLAVSAINAIVIAVTALTIIPILCKFLKKINM